MRDRRAVLALLCFARVTMGLQFQSIAPIAPLLAADLRLSYAQLGLLIGVFMVPGALLSLPGGLLGDRFGDRRIMLVALALLSGGRLVVAGSRSIAVALVGRLLQRQRRRAAEPARHQSPSPRGSRVRASRR